MECRRQCTRAQVIVLLNLLWVSTTVLCQNFTGPECEIGERPSLIPLSENFKLQLNSSVLLNLDNSSTCNGTVNTWSVCYSSESSAEQIRVGIWQNVNDTYILVNDSLTVIPDGELNDAINFACQTIAMPQANSLEEGVYVVGVVVPSLPAGVNVVGFDTEREIWAMSVSETGDYLEVNNSSLRRIEDYGLYIEAFYTEQPNAITEETSTSSSVITIPESEPEDQAGQPVWPNVVVPILSVCLLVLTVVTCSLCVILAKQRKRYRKVEGSRLQFPPESGHSETVLTNIDITSFKQNKGYNGSTSSTPDIESNHPVSNQVNTLQDIFPSPIVIENTNRERHCESRDVAEPPAAAQKNKPRAQTFTFPPPEDKAPLPPGEKSSDPLLSPDLQRPLPLSPLSASSLPNLLSDGVYENVKSPAPAQQSHKLAAAAPGKKAKQEETGYAETSPPKSGFAFPPPEVKAPLPPPEDHSDQTDGREREGSTSTAPETTGTASPVLNAATSLPNLNSNEDDMYEKVSLTPKQRRSTATPARPSHLPTNRGPVVRNGTVPHSDSNSSNNNTTHKTPPSKTKVGRMLSAPMPLKSPDYAEPISAEHRARFYSHRGPKVTKPTRKTGGFKPPMLPPPAPTSRAAGVVTTGSRGIKSPDQLEFSDSLENIAEVEEVESPTAITPEQYLEPVKSKPKPKPKK